MKERLDSLFKENISTYGMEQRDKEQELLSSMNEISIWHYDRCAEYKAFLDGHGKVPPYESLMEIPAIPTSIFKDFDLVSLPAGQSSTLKSIQSSSTSSGTPSRIFVDGDTSVRQKKSVQLIFNDFLGNRRRPYIIFDAMETARGKSALSARGAAIMSLMGYASQFYFVMDTQDGQLVLNEEKLRSAVEAAKQDGCFLAYGFTYILYQAHETMERLGIKLNGFDNDSFFIHSGGWKKLQSMAVDKATFNQRIVDRWSMAPAQVIDFYGLVEQTGVIYPDCSAGNKHVPYYADIVIRDPHTMAVQPEGETGLIQLMNALPLSAPNHSVITDDLGVIVSTDQCACGRKGKAFRFVGRAPKAEVRGCGDVYAEGSAR